jgi:hypothetical protein
VHQLVVGSGGGHEAVVRLLLEKGIEADSKDKYRQMPLSWVAAGAHEAVVQLLRFLCRWFSIPSTLGGPQPE